jgi:hypothetical protein
MVWQLLELCDLGSSPERRFRLLELTRARLCIAEAEEEFAVDPGVDARLELENLQGELEEPRRFLVRQQPDRTFTGAASVGDCLIRVSRRGSVREVVCELGEVWLEVAPVPLFEALADLAMKPHAL